VFALLALVFVVVPLVELYVIVQVGEAIGVWNTIGVLLLVSFVGAWLTKHEGFYVLQRVRERLARGEVPGNEMIDGLLILLGGLLLLLPGFVTDAAGLVLLFPPTRALARAYLRRRFSLQVTTVTRYRRGPGGGPGGGPDDVIDV
jgi:UPF0716 protein FxsA